LSLRAQALEEVHKLETEEDDGLNGRTPIWRVALLDPITDKRKVEHGIEVSVEVISRDESFQRDKYGAVEMAQFGWTEHDDEASTSVGSRSFTTSTYPRTHRSFTRPGYFAIHFLHGHRIPVCTLSSARASRDGSAKKGGDRVSRIAGGM
jgi:hypothetical protein